MARPIEFDKQTVLTGAMEQFWKEGYEASSVDKLLKCTGINRGTMYNSFGNKEDLFRQCLAHYEVTVIAPLLEDLCNPKQQNHLAAIDTFFGKVVSTDRGMGCLLVNSLCGAEVNNGKIFIDVDNILVSIRKALLSRLKPMKRAGGLKMGITAEFGADVLMNALHAIRVRSRGAQPRRTTRKLADFAILSLCYKPAG